MAPCCHTPAAPRRRGGRDDGDSVRCRAASRRRAPDLGVERGGERPQERRFLGFARSAPALGARSGLQASEPFLDSGEARCELVHTAPALIRCSGSGRGPGRGGVTRLTARARTAWPGGSASGSGRCSPPAPDRRPCAVNCSCHRSTNLLASAARSGGPDRARASWRRIIAETQLKKAVARALSHCGIVMLRSKVSHVAQHQGSQPA